MVQVDDQSGAVVTTLTGRETQLRGNRCFAVGTNTHHDALVPRRVSKPLGHEWRDIDTQGALVSGVGCADPLRSAASGAKPTGKRRGFGTTAQDRKFDTHRPGTHRAIVRPGQFEPG